MNLLGREVPETSLMDKGTLVDVSGPHRKVCEKSATLDC